MIINNAKIITKDRIFENGSLLIEDGLISKIGLSSEIVENEKDLVYDARGQYLFPGNICAHTHFYGAYSRGMSIPGEAPDAFPNILKKLWWNLDKSLDADAIYYSALTCLISAIRYGTTTLFDHHASPNYISNSLDILEKAVEQSGLRGCLCYEVSDRDGEEKSKQGIAENLRFIEKCRARSSEKIKAMFGLHASLTLNDKTLEEARKVTSYEVGFHIHAAEHPVDQFDCISKHGMRVIERLNHFGLLSNRTIVAHAVHIDASEMELLRKNACWVSHQPRSNMNNAVGLPQIESMQRFGIKICLGNDGFSNAMWEEWKAAYLGHKSLRSDPRVMPADLISTIAIQNNAALTNRIFENQKIGIIEENAAADLILVDYKPITSVTMNNLPWHIIFGLNESMITTTMCSGNILMKDRQLTEIDEELVMKEAFEVSKFVWRKYQNIAG